MEISTARRPRRTSPPAAIAPAILEMLVSNRATLKDLSQSAQSRATSVQGPDTPPVPPPPLAVTDGSVTENLNETGVRLWTDRSLVEHGEVRLGQSQVAGSKPALLRHPESENSRRFVLLAGPEHGRRKVWLVG